LSKWWSGNPQEHYWLESTDRADIGGDLRAPMSDSSGKTNWRYSLFTEALPGDVVFHYDGNADAIVGSSIVDGPPVEQPITWAARGTYARERGARPASVPGYAIPLRDYQPLITPLSLETLRLRKQDLQDLVSDLRLRHEGAALYFPFELARRPVRPMQGYAFKLPSEFVGLFGLERVPDTSGPLTISSDAGFIRRGFDIWRDAMVEGASWHGHLWTQPEGSFVVRNQPERGNDVLGPRTALGVDPAGDVWAVQINEARKPGNRNVTSAIAVDSAGRPFLIRQGRLRPNPDCDEEILYDEFRSLTGLSPVQVTNGSTRIRRDWYVVTALDLAPHRIRMNTGRFVDACVEARRAKAAPSLPEDTEALARLNAGDEAGGTYVIGAQDARPEREIRRMQGEVWLQLASLLRSRNIKVDKPRHAAGYEVDAEIVSSERKLLVEIKTEVRASDVYTGLGQLQIYATLLPSLGKHERVLLLPGLPSGPLVEALQTCGVRLCTYRIKFGKTGPQITFDPEFLQLCGIGEVQPAQKR